MADLYVLYRQNLSGIAFEMGANTNRPGIARTFTIRKSALNFAKKHGAKVAHINFPDEGAPTVVSVLDPEEELK